jgi:hypothetical protein
MTFQIVMPAKAGIQRIQPQRHREHREVYDSVIARSAATKRSRLDCFASLAVTGDPTL